MFRTSSTFDKLLDRATSNLRLEPDWPAIIQICDLIRQSDVPAKYALTAIKKKIYHANPHVAMFGLQVLESAVKNCGNLIHDEIGTRAYMEQMQELVKSSPHENVRNKCLELLQVWAHAFRNSAKYRPVQDQVNILKTEGYQFPALKESDAMFSADTAPEWAEGECCHRCRVQFSMMQRKHHCRACGQVFCNQCSAKTSTLPKFGIEKEVRVCESCFEKVNKPGPAIKGSEAELPAEYLASTLAQQSQTPAKKTEEELREEEEFQLALALSKSEAEEKEKEREKQRMRTEMINSAYKQSQNSPSKQLETELKLDNGENTGELARYLNRGYWEQRQEGLPSAPATASTTSLGSPVHLSPRKFQENGGNENLEDFIRTLRSQIEIFVNRMKSNSSRGRSIANDSSVQTLFLNITSMHSQLLKHITEEEDRRIHFEGLQDKLAQLRDARAALDALREEHREKLRRQAEEQDRIRQMQMAQKLDMMRQKKQEYLQYQRHLALQRIQEQEREMQMRQEQQKQHYMAMGSGYPFPPQHYPPEQYGAMPPPPHAMSPASHYPPYPDYQQYQPRMMMQPPMGSMPPQMGPPTTQPQAMPMGAAPSGAPQMPPGVPMGVPAGQMPPPGAPQQIPQGMIHQGMPPGAQLPPPGAMQMQPPSGYAQQPQMGQPMMQPPYGQPSPMISPQHAPQMQQQQPPPPQQPPNTQTAELISFD
ncbi:hepatocyte growth factor-regulated tyrosine kinase substrate [Neocloeon triangulifer]|uniref:hepatocyte growth factor-regulated tyrosine kinase substrate n=1 Tax=Neocloeon triangulifer TaxID=2078957 RepID=UPI00286F093A|nr:hepatocyte growth factor-regulated tyrosine kinase substrate [Neocloeon triangulifer]